MTAPWEDTRVAAGLRRQLTTRRRVLDEGAAGIGWKVGFGAPASLDLMDITAPLVGFLTDATVFPSGDHIDTSGWIRGVVEFELAVYLGADLGPGASLHEAGAAISAVGPAMELANIDLPVEASFVEDIVAGNIFHEAVVLGASDEGRAGLDITGLVARILVDGEEWATTTDLQAITGAYPLIVATVANTLAATGMTLRAGDLIITGSVVPPIPVTEGTEFSFVLEPFAPISVAVV